MKESDLTKERLSKFIRYIPETGEFWWIGKKGKINREKQAGCVLKGYLCIKIDGRSFFAHRLAFLLMTGSFPSEQVDHKNGNKLDNRFCNLTKASASENMCNRICKGYSYNTITKQWYARIKKDGVYYYLGSYDSPQKAKMAYLKAKQMLHPTASVYKGAA